ncbi:hypothetical protein V491_07246 [Pseudogymnoascus sp. VKM F-3775]|nr:hypothetical protein V491_07246 [Pseudogymnoascus sp. VKM F-3775]
MLIQAYTGGRPAEFVHASKGKASQDPLGAAEEGGSKRHHQKGDEDNCLPDTTDQGTDLDYDGDGGFNAAPQRLKLGGIQKNSQQRLTVAIARN